jgi:hypothetical protein
MHHQAAQESTEPAMEGGAMEVSVIVPTLDSEPKLRGALSRFDGRKACSPR